MTSSAEHKKSSEFRRRESAPWWMRDLLEAVSLCDRCGHVPSLIAIIFQEKRVERARKSEKFQRERAISREILRIGSKRAGERSNEAPAVLPTFHRMRVHPKRPISCSLNLGSAMGVWEMGHQDGEKSSSRMLWVHKKIHNFPILAASASFSFSSRPPLVALNGPGVLLCRDLSQRWWRCVCSNLLCWMPSVAPTAGRRPALRSCRSRIGEWSASAHVEWVVLIR